MTQEFDTSNLILPRAIEAENRFEALRDKHVPPKMLSDCMQVAFALVSQLAEQQTLTPEDRLQAVKDGCAGVLQRVKGIDHDMASATTLRVICAFNLLSAMKHHPWLHEQALGELNKDGKLEFEISGEFVVAAAYCPMQMPEIGELQFDIYEFRRLLDRADAKEAVN